MKRRQFVSGVLAAGLVTEVIGGQEHEHEARPLEGPLANATVSFGAWPIRLSDRLIPPPQPAPPPPNVHQLLPYSVTIKAGGAVNFIVAGFHNIAVYGPGTTFESIDETILMPVPGAPVGFPPLVNDSRNRVFRGANPFTQPQDRVEVVHFGDPGTYLVICAFLPHFNDKMHGWVKVVK